MLYMDSLGGLVLLALWIFCIVDVVMTPEGAARNLPKLLWLLIVVFLPDIGSILWLALGHPWAPRPAKNGFYAGAQSNGFPEYERLGRSTAEDPQADAEFLRQCRERAEAQRARYKDSRKDQSES